MDNLITEYLALPKDICLPPEAVETIDEKLIKALIELHDKNTPRYLTLQGYYEGKAKILERQKDSTKVNNKLVMPYASYIVDILLGMFVGKPVSYSVSKELKEKMRLVQGVLDMNDEQDENTELAKMAGIKGRAYEVVYKGDDNLIHFNEVNPENIIFVFDDKIKAVPLFAMYIRSKIDADKLDKESEDKLVTIYTTDEVIEYEVGKGIVMLDRYPHPFGEVPVIEFLNNNEGIGDFERVINLIDAINLSQSDTSNDFVEFTDAILVLSGMLQTDEDDIKRLIEDKVVLLDSSESGKQGAQWLIKDVNDTAVENYKNRLDIDIHKFAKVPNLADEHFASNISGEAMKFKLFATDQAISQKQRKFKTALQTRLRLIINALNIGIDASDISIIFNDNKPFNELDNINTVKAAIDAGLSKTYALGKLRDIDDIQEELDRQAEEEAAYEIKDEVDGFTEQVYQAAE